MREELSALSQEVAAAYLAMKEKASSLGAVSTEVEELCERAAVLMTKLQQQTERYGENPSDAVNADSIKAQQETVAAQQERCNAKQQAIEEMEARKATLLAEVAQLEAETARQDGGLFMLFAILNCHIEILQKATSEQAAEHARMLSDVLWYEQATALLSSISGITVEVGVQTQLNDC